MRSSSKLLALAVVTAGLVLPTTAAFAWGDGDGSRQRGEASSYINRDTGAATENADVNADSSCAKPDQYDMQAFSPAGTGTKNVHNDACFLDYDGKKLDGPASFQSSGVGFISACPDPDGAGPKTAVNRDTNGDGRNDLCFQTGNQNKGIAGDLEFHARMNNNTGAAGTQVVVWCSDADRDGCDDEYNKSTIRIDWSADGKASFSNDRSYSDGSRWGY